jgi:SSS family solute:Na+ symporter
MNFGTSDHTALSVFVFFFFLVTLLGFVASRWKAGDLSHLHEWGLGGRNFGSWISWFLIGGDFYTAYTVIAVPALVYGQGAIGFFALPYTIIVYPIVFFIMPKLWAVCHKNHYITAADFVHAEYGGRLLPSMIALTGIVAVMPYIALQLVGMQVAIKGLGITGEIPLIVAFLLLALYTYSSGLRAPALIAFVKDIMIYIVVIAAIWIIPEQLGGYGQIFRSANDYFTAKGGATGVILKPNQMSAFATLALGSAMAGFMYPHTLTAILSSKTERTIKINAMTLPAYSILLGLIAMLGYMAIAAGVQTKSPNDIVMILFAKLFPAWFVGFAGAAIAIAALVPAAIMSIGAANLFTRNLWKPFLKREVTSVEEAKNAKLFSLFVKIGALLIIILMPTKFSIDLQLLGGVWILQTFPTVVFTLFFKRLNQTSLLIGWVIGIALGTYLAFMQGLKPVYLIPVFGHPVSLYIGLIAFAANASVAMGLSLVMPSRHAAPTY